MPNTSFFIQSYNHHPNFNIIAILVTEILGVLNLSYKDNFPLYVLLKRVIGEELKEPDSQFKIILTTFHKHIFYLIFRLCILIHF